jgi:hypothetical protein
MNGPYHAASQWIWVNFQLFEDGTIQAPLSLTNNVFGQDFCGGVRVELHDLRNNNLLQTFDSPILCISRKGINGQANTPPPVGWTIKINNPEVFATFRAYPSLNMVNINYSTSDPLIQGIGDVFNVAGQIIQNIGRDNGNGDG